MDPSFFSVPDDVPAHCPGPQSDYAGKTDSCEGCPNKVVCASGFAKLSLEEREPEVVSKLRKRLGGVKQCIFILSGKGGVGKSSISTCLAWSLSKQNQSSNQIGLLDLDICGPSIPCLLGCFESEVHKSATGWSPVYVSDNLALMSVGFLTSPDQALIWRGPRKNAFIRDLLCNVAWGEDDETSRPLDFLLIDTPPGTSDEHLSSVPYLKAAGCPITAVIVTTPQEVALSDVRKEINFCEKIGLPILGIVENMTGVQCPKCGVFMELYPKTTGGADSLNGLDVIARIPLDSRLTRCLDEGRCPFDPEGNDPPSELGVMKIFDDLATTIKSRISTLLT